MATQRIIERWNQDRLNVIVTQLETWRDNTQESLDNEEMKNNPNAERVDQWQARVDLLQEAIDALEQIN